jgi:hypothetical protein
VVKETSIANRDVALAAGLGLFLVAVYFSTFAGVLRSIDELSLFASTENVVLGGSLQPLLVRFAEFHNRVGLLEPGYSLLAVPLYALARRWPAVSNIHAVMLLNPLLTALNASLLYGLGRRLRYGEAASLSVALVFGLATMAWPYTKSFLREPAVALLWTAAFWGLVQFVEAPEWGAGALAVVPVVAAVGVKVASIVSWPVIFIALGWTLYTSQRFSRRWLLVGGLAALALSVGLALFLLAQRNLPVSGLINNLVANPFTLESLAPWYGLLASPGKSVFVYSPVVLLGVIGWPAFYRRHAVVAVTLVLLSAALLFALRTSNWWGGLTWGPRFLAPLLPLMLLPALELFPQRKWAWGLAGLSAAYQALVSTAAWPVAYQSLLTNYPIPDATIGLDWTRWMESPAVQIVRRWGRAALDLAWLHPGLAHAERMKLDLGLGVTLVLAVSVTALALLAIWRGQRIRLALAVSGATVFVAAPVLLTRAYAALPDYDGLPAGLARALAADLTRDPYSPTRIVNVSSDFGMHPWLGLLKGKATTVWISPAEEGSDFASLLPTEPGARLAVVVDRPHIASLYPGDRLVTWLNVNTYRFESHWIEGYEGYEIFHYAVTANTGASTPSTLEWPNGIALTRWAAPARVRRGTVLPIDLTLTCLKDDWGAFDVLFTHLIAPDGTVISGQDGLLQYGNLGAGGWRAGQSALDRRGIWIPLEAAPGEYDLIVGFANAQGFVRLTLPLGETVDYASLTHITIEP